MAVREYEENLASCAARAQRLARGSPPRLRTDPIMELEDIARSDEIHAELPIVLEDAVDALQRLAVEYLALKRYGDVGRLLHLDSALEKRLHGFEGHHPSDNRSWLQQDRRTLTNSLFALFQGDSSTAIDRLENDIQKSFSTPTRPDGALWPLVYVLSLLHMSLGSLHKAVPLLSKLMSAGTYRAADVTALAARAKFLLSNCEDNAKQVAESSLDLWERTLILDSRRSASLWGAASIMNIAGYHEQSADLLRCLHEMKSAERATQSQRTILRLPGQKFNTFEEMGDMQITRVERARQLASDQRTRATAVEAYDSMLETSNSAQERTRLGLERAWALALLGDHEGALKSLEGLNPVSSVEKVMSCMCKANALVCAEDFDGAFSALEQARMEPAIMDGPPHSSRWSRAALQELRSVLALNRGVLLACRPTRKRRGIPSVALASTDTALSAIEMVPKRYKRPRTDIIETAAHFNRSLLERESSEPHSTWLAFRGLEKDALRRSNFPVIDLERNRGDWPSASYHYVRLTVDSVPSSEAARLDQVSIERQRALQMESSVSLEVRRIERRSRAQEKTFEQPRGGNSSSITK